MEEDWTPPGRDCGACGHGTCNEFLLALKAGTRKKEECPFSSQLFCQERPGTKRSDETVDILGDSYDFILYPLPENVRPEKFSSLSDLTWWNGGISIQVTSLPEDPWVPVARSSIYPGFVSKQGIWCDYYTCCRAAIFTWQRSKGS